MTAEQMKQWLIQGAFWAGCLAAVWLGGKYLLRWFAPFLLGFLIAYILRPVARFVDKHSGMGARGASIVAAAVFYGVSGILLWLAGLYLFGQLSHLLAALPAFYQETAAPFLGEFSRQIAQATARFPRVGAGTSGLLNMANEALGAASASASQWGIDLVGKLLGALPLFGIALIFTILSSVLICMDYQGVSAAVTGRIPRRWLGAVLQVRDFLFATLGKSLKAYLILMLITFGELVLGLWLLGAAHPLAAAAVIALLDLLPILGSGAVLLPWAAYSLLAGRAVFGWGMLGLWAAISVVRQVLEPRILGKQIGLHPLLAVTAMYAGLRIAGVGGMIAAPIVCLLAMGLADGKISQ